jgi:hypothetical protein
MQRGPKGEYVVGVAEMHERVLQGCQLAATTHQSSGLSCRRLPSTNDKCLLMAVRGFIAPNRERGSYGQRTRYARRDP